MSRKEDEAVGLFIYMIRKIWDVYYKESSTAQTLWCAEEEEWHAESAPQVHDVCKDVLDTTRKRPSRRIKPKGSTHSALREPGPLRETPIDSNHRRLKNTPSTSNDINYKDGVLFTKFKIRTNDCADKKKLKNSRHRH